MQNPYTSDALLTSYVNRYCPPEHRDTIETDLTRFGERILTEVDQLGIECEENQPRLQRTDAWGKRIDDIWVTPAWYGQHRVSLQYCSSKGQNAIENLDCQSQFEFIF